eukprot:CAMPEP_0203916358 /NCGR_PEP_ID=MMETSP0359-20131031/57074_1 /ASSEMBLY_ACC=CAM_ASM_000338 /TAXON_ID=268821 /ORGANISM="Scrippsiella Hangoei, Strain SHTV-5" /LENGTH=130 /DNA_ID=CAMNT_0050843045 /DNA_START=49 /DNA_END=438 /DNA_ORIENTATION=-
MNLDQALRQAARVGVEIGSAHNFGAAPLLAHNAQRSKGAPLLGQQMFVQRMPLHAGGSSVLRGAGGIATSSSTGALAADASKLAYSKVQAPSGIVKSSSQPMFRPPFPAHVAAHQQSAAPTRQAPLRQAP